MCAYFNYCKITLNIRLPWDQHHKSEGVTLSDLSCYLFVGTIFSIVVLLFCGLEIWTVVWHLYFNNTHCVLLN